jgi:hypothetical protein
MDPDIPVPDFSLIDIFPARFSSYVKTFDSGIPFPEVSSVVGYFGFVLVQDSPLWCTSNSSVYPALDRIGDVCALKISRIHAGLAPELHNRLLLGECSTLVSSYDIFQTEEYSIL